MLELLLEYVLFFAKAITIVVAIGIVTAIIVGATRKERGGERLEVRNINDKYGAMAEILRRESLPKKALKEWEKTEKEKKKKEAKQQKTQNQDSARRRIFLLNFDGDIRASACAELREEITAVLGLATPKDEIVVRLESAGGLVHEHGLAASQLMRIRQREIPLTVTVDKVAASGGYMMACVANRIIAAPFAVLGSIGVLAQLPNFHRLLDRHGIDFEQIQAGEFKRTVTFFGKNTDKDREKLQEEIQDTHELFKAFIVENRPDVPIAQVATGEHWYGRRALELKLVDELMTSDDYLLAASETADVFEVLYTAKKSVSERIAAAVQMGVESALEKLLLSWRGSF